jgi:hypothetical protein
MGRTLALVGGVAWLVAIALIAVAVQWSGRPRIVSRLATGPTLIKELNAARPAAPKEGQSWTVTRATAAHHVLVVNVTADRVADARTIAAAIVDPVLNRGYDEILVYVWRAQGQRPYADRRIQWTRRDGYKELVIGD